MAKSCKDGNDSLGSIKGEGDLLCLSDCQLLEKDSVPLSRFSYRLFKQSLNC